MDSELEIIDVRINNDYHLLQARDRRNFLPPDADGTTAAHDLIRRQALKDLGVRNLPSDQYGTNLSIAKPIDYRQSPDPPQDQSSIAHDQPGLLDFPTEYQQSILDYYIPTKPMSIHSYSLLDNVISNFYIDTISSFYEKSQNKLQDLITKKRTEAISIVKPLSPNQLTKVTEIWTSGDGQVNNNYSIGITTSDLQTLREPKWLNDNVIDYYFNLIMKEYPEVFGWTTHFYTALESRGYQGVARWAKRKKIDLFQKAKVLVPVNIANTHWALAVIDNMDRTITYYDSLNTVGNPQAVANLATYMDGEAKRLGLEPITYDLIPHVTSPQQKNGSDCGVFTCTTARYISGDKKLNFSQDDMKVIRRKMVYEILENNLLE
ncbi:Senp1 Sentrin-specific protease 1 [Candida maltosa Xu316]